MDEFDKIREISEDLTHRREPTFTQLGNLNQTPSASNPAATARETVAQNTTSSQNVHPTEQEQRIQNIQSFLNQPFQSNADSEKTYNFANVKNDKIDFIQPETLQEKPFSSMKLHLIGITVFSGILGIVLAGFFFFNSDSDNLDEIVTITTAPSVVKVSPTQAGGITIPDQDKLVYNRIRSGNVTTKVESLFPEPEKPVMPQILSIEEESAEEKFVNINNVKAVNPLDEPKKNAVPVAEKNGGEKSVISEKNESIQPSQSEKPTVIEKDATSLPVPPKEPAIVAQQSAVLPLPKAESVQKETTQQIKQPTIQEAKKSGNIWRVQLFATNNKAAVEKAWKRISTTHKSLLSNMSYTIEPAEIKGKGTFYRLKVGQFATRDMAAALCTKLKAKKQDCVPTK